MILNPTRLRTVEAEWEGVIRMRERMDHLVVTTFAFDPITSPVFGNILYNLPLLLAFDVLRQVLMQWEDRDTTSGHSLEELLDGARTTVPWMDWQCLREAVDRRKEVAHDGRLLGDKQCLQDIANIESQLQAWGVITAP